MSFSIPLDIRWSDLDPNFHLRHSVYYDYGAFARVLFLTGAGLTVEVLAQYQFGPIIFREEAVFKREVRFGDKLTINSQIMKAREDYSRWTIQHELWKNGDTLAAILTLDGAWMDTAKRKLFIPPAFVIEAFDKLPKHESFYFDKPVK